MSAESEARRQQRAAETGICLRCKGAIQPWRDHHLCAGCARNGRTSSKRCARCEEVGHRQETCFEPPPDWIPSGESRTWDVAVPLSEQQVTAVQKNLADLELKLERMEREHQRRCARHRERKRKLLEQKAAFLAQYDKRQRTAKRRVMATHEGRHVVYREAKDGRELGRRPVTAREAAQ